MADTCTGAVHKAPQDGGSCPCGAVTRVVRSASAVTERLGTEDAGDVGDEVLVDGDWISPSREAHARDLTRSWADAAQNAGCPPAFVARMRTFVDVHDRLHAAALASSAHGRVEPRAGLRSAEQVAQRFHQAYERLAPSFGYETRRQSAVPWEQVPEANRRLMTAVCAEVLAPVVELLKDERWATTGFVPHAYLQRALERGRG